MMERREEVSKEKDMLRDLADAFKGKDAGTGDDVPSSQTGQVPR